MHRNRGSNKKTGVERSPPRRRRSPDNRESFYCSYCKCQLLTKQLYDEHNRSPVHKQKRILIEKAIGDGLQFCYTCEKIFPNKIELDAHCLMSRHQPLYRVEEMHEFRKRKEESNTPTMLPSSSNEADQRRLKDSKERKDIVLKLNKMKESDPDQIEMDLNFEARNAVYCKVCNVDCMNASNFKIHNDSWRHRAEMDKRAESMEKKMKETVKVKENEAKQQKPNVPTNLISVLQYFCEVCSAPCTSEENYLMHCRGKKHLRRISTMQRPYKCYTCHEDFNAEKPYSIHLESRAHIEKAFKSRNKEALKSSVSNEEWIEKRDRNIEGEQKKEHERRSHKDDRRKSVERHADERRERVEKPTYSSSRKVEIIPSGPEDSVADLREKLKGKNVLVTQSVKNEFPDKSSINNAIIAERNDMDKRAKEKEFEAKFKKVSQEYENNLDALKQRLTMEREQDIAAYQRYENTYKRLCEEEDFIREDLRVLQEGDPRKEEYIRDMIRIQGDMREVRQELEFREMMIIKRETLFRSKFPNADNKVILNKNDNSAAIIDYQHGNTFTAPAQPSMSANQLLSGSSKEGDDLRLELERERLLKRLGPELEAIDPVIREKLLSVILNKDISQIEKTSNPQSTMKNTPTLKGEKVSLNDREKQLEKELEQLRTKATPITTERKRITKSLVPQYDDDDEKTVKKSHRSESSISQNTSDSEDSKQAKKRHRKRSPISRSRGRSKRSRSTDSDDVRKKRKRSRSRDRKRKPSGKKNDDRKRKSDQKKIETKPIKMKLQARQTQNMIKSVNPLPDDSNSEEEKLNKVQLQSTSMIPVIGSNTMALQQQLQPTFGNNEPIMHNPAKQVITQQRLNVNQIPPQPRREQFSLWNRAAAPSKPSDSPKEDVWDIAFSGGKVKENDMTEISNIFSTNTELPRQLPTEILDILRNVAPMLHNISSPSIQPEQALHTLRQKPEQRISQKPTQDQAEPYAAKKLSTNVSQESAINAGGKVRSILKKIKDPVPVMLEENHHGEETKVKATPTHIPGLDLPEANINRDLSKVELQARNYSNEMDPQEGNEESVYSHENYSNVIRGQQDRGLNSRTDQRDDNNYRALAFSSGLNVNDNVESERYNPSPNLRKKGIDIITSGSSHRAAGRQVDPYHPLHEEAKRSTNDYQPHYDDNRDPYHDSNSVKEGVRRIPQSENISEDKRSENFQRDDYSRYSDSFTPPHQDRWIPSREVSWIRDNMRQIPVDNFPIPGREDPRILAPRLEPTWGHRDDQRLLPPVDDSRNLPRGYEEPPKDYHPRERLPPYIDDRLPIRRDGESEDQFYERFERFYALKRESERDGINYPPPPVGDPRNLPDPRAMARDDFYRRREQVNHPDDRYLRPVPPFAERVDDTRMGRAFVDFEEVNAPLRDERQPNEGDRKFPPKEFNQYDDRRRLGKEINSFPVHQRLMEDLRPTEVLPVKLPHDIRNGSERRSAEDRPMPGRIAPNNQRGQPNDPYAPKQVPPPRRPHFNKPNY